MSENLLNCPFCGGEAKHYTGDVGFPERQAGCFNQDCRMYSVIFGESVWDTRTQLPEVEAVLEAAFKLKYVWHCKGHGGAGEVKAHLELDRALNAYKESKT